MSRVRVSDHAIVTWLEQVEGVDVEAIRRRIAKAVGRAAPLEPEGVRVDGVTFKLQYNPGEAVVTMAYSPHHRPHLAEDRLSIRELQALREIHAPFLWAQPDDRPGDD